MVTSDAIQILGTDALSGLRSLPSETVQVSLTSPPFYLLRRYGTSVFSFAMVSDGVPAGATRPYQVSISIG